MNHFSSDTFFQINSFDYENSQPLIHFPTLLSSMTIKYHQIEIVCFKSSPRKPFSVKCYTNIWGLWLINPLLSSIPVSESKNHRTTTCVHSHFVFQSVWFRTASPLYITEYNNNNIIIVIRNYRDQTVCRSRWLFGPYKIWKTLFWTTSNQYV